MSRNKPERLLALSALASVVALVVACGGSSGTSYVEDGKPLSFPTFNPYSGPDASFGPELGAGCYPAAKAVAAAGGVLGHLTIACSAVDSRGDPADAVPAAQKMLVFTHNLMTVTGPSSDEASVIVPQLEAAHIPMFADTGQVNFDKSTFHYFWRITNSDDYYGYAEALYAYDSGYRNAAMVFGNDISSQGTVPTILSAFKKLGGTISINLSVALDQASYRSEAQRLVAAKPDVIFNELDPQTASTFFGELKQLNGLAPFISTAAHYAPWIKAVRDAVGATTLASVYHEVLSASFFSGPAYDQFNTGLLASSADVPNPQQWSQDIYSEAGFDTVIISCLAMLAAGTTNPKVWNDYILKVTTNGPGATVVNTFADGKLALAAGKTIAYVGATGPFAFDQYHNNSVGFEVLGYDASTGNTPVLKTYAAGAVNTLIGS